MIGENSGSGRLAMTGGKTMSRGLSISRSELPMYPSITTLAIATVAANFREYRNPENVSASFNSRSLTFSRSENSGEGSIRGRLRNNMRERRIRASCLAQSLHSAI